MPTLKVGHTMHEDIPQNLRGLMAELDALAGSTSGPDELDGLPNLSGTDFAPLREIGRRGIAALESLAARFPKNLDIQQALEKLHYALKVHARLKARRETAAESSDGRRPGSPHFK